MLAADGRGVITGPNDITANAEPLSPAVESPTIGHIQRRGDT
jgi:hypothetical protein